jgi:AraC-like DNA-binding protein
MTVRTAATAEEWAMFSSEAFVPVRVDASPALFSGTLDHRGTQRGGISFLRTDSCRIIRTSDLLGGSADDMSLFSIQIKGRSGVAQSERHARLAPGDGVLYLSRAPYELIFPDASELAILQVPTEWYGMATASIAGLTALPFHLRADPALRTFTRVVRSLFAEQPVISDSAEAVRVAAELLASALRRRSQLPASGRSHGALFASLERVIHDHLEDPGLNVAALAVAEHVSVRTVHTVFAERGMHAGAAIRDARMERAKRLLSSTNLAMPDIALRSGISDASVFSRTFRAYEGVTPSTYRSHSRTTP